MTAPLPVALSDEELMARVQRDDRSAYEQLYSRHRARVFGFLCRRTGAREQAEEAHQETWLRVYRWRQRFDPSRRFGPWLFAIAANAGRDAMKPQPALMRLPLQPSEPQDWSFPDGEVLARATFTRGESVAYGPVVGLGTFWRLPPFHDPQLGPMATVGGRVSVPLGPAWLAVGIELHAVPLDGQPAVYPSVAVSAGARLR